MKKVVALLAILVGIVGIGFSATSATFGGNVVLGFGVFGVSGYYGVGTDLDFQLPNLGTLEFGSPRVYIGPGITYVSVSGVSGFSLDAFGEILVPIKSLSFKVFGVEFQPAVGLEAWVDYWLVSVPWFGYEGLDFDLGPRVTFFAKPVGYDVQAESKWKWWAYFWPYPVTIGFGAYK